MAELSDADKRSLLGRDYKEDQGRRDIARGVTDASRLAEEQANRSTNIIIGAAGVGIVAFLIGIANYRSIGTAYNAALVTGCAVVVVLAGLALAWSLRARKSAR